VQERYTYDGYGRCRVLTPAYDGRKDSVFDWEFRYTGRRQDLESGLCFFRARYYHAELGRFLSRDPSRYVDGMSLYRAYFVPGMVDPNGRKRCKCTSKILGQSSATITYENVLDNQTCSSLNASGEWGFKNCQDAPTIDPATPTDILTPENLCEGVKSCCCNCEKDVKKLLEYIRSVPKKTWAKDGFGTCEKWVREFVTGPVPSSPCYKIRVRYWEYPQTNILNIFPWWDFEPLSHCALEVTICNGKRFYADNWWWGGDDKLFVRPGANDPFVTNTEPIR
jgi:RHS repeat-associated protein